jgi:hypothetical protein
MYPMEVTSAPNMPIAVQISGVTQAGMWAESHCSAGLSSGPNKMSFTLSCFSIFIISISS